MRADARGSILVADDAAQCAGQRGVWADWGLLPSLRPPLRPSARWRGTRPSRCQRDGSAEPGCGPVRVRLVGGTPSHQVTIRA
jgi:hypothetical protein